MPPKRKRPSYMTSDDTPNTRRSKPDVAVPRDEYDDLNQDWRGVLRNERGRLYVMLDVGTITHGAHYATDGEGNADPLCIQAQQLSLDASTSLQPAVLGFEERPPKKSGQRVFLAVHGEEARRRCLRGDILPNNIFHNLKQSEPFFNVQELDSSECPEYLRKIQQTHAELLSRLQDSEVILYHAAYAEAETLTIETMKDVVCLQMRLLRLDIINALATVSGAGVSTFVDLFSSESRESTDTKLLIGVSAPDLWKRQIKVLYEALVDAGFPPQLEILSEARSAAAAMLRSRYDKISHREGKKSSEEIKNLANKVMMVLDRGGHTLDISSMRLTRVAMTNKKTSLKFRAVTASTSTEDGGDRVTDRFMKQIIEVLGKQYPSVVRHLSVQNGTDGELVLREGFLNSIEQEKAHLGLRRRENKVTLTFEHIRELPPGGNNLAGWEEKKLTLTKRRLEKSVDDAARAIVAENGPLLTHVRLTRQVEPDSPIEIILSGGGSKDMLLREKVKKLINEHPEMDDVTFGVEDHNGKSLVSMGGIYLLVDPRIGDVNKVTLQSYGMVLTEEFDPSNSVHQLRAHEKRRMRPHASVHGYQNRFELADTVNWLKVMGSRVRNTSKIIEMSRQFELDVGEEPHPERLIDVCFEIVSTDDKTLGLVDGCNAREVGIKHATEFSFEMKAKDLARFTRPVPEATHGFVEYESEITGKKIPGWKMEFDCRILYRWAGMLQIFEVRIPVGGYFPEERELTRSEMCIRRFQIIGECEIQDD